MVTLRTLTVDDWPLWRAVRLGVYPDNTAAVTLYERHEYRPAGVDSGLLRMVKPLR